VREWHPDEIVSTCLGLGFLTKMPGTLASFAAVAVAMLLSINAVLIILLAVLGGIASWSYSKRIGVKDPSEVVIDEVVGMWISLYGFGSHFFLPALGLFRILDIIKPFPIKNAEKLPAGIGIMADDVLAGLLTNIILRGLSWFFLSGGLRVMTRI
jgi:phosphatidylglycerophosphatase A